MARIDVDVKSPAGGVCVCLAKVLLVATSRYYLCAMYVSMYLLLSVIRVK